MLQLLTIPVALATLLLRAHAQRLQDCYAYDGEIQSDNVVCEGSGACCNAQATCTEQRLCHNQGDPENVFVRGPCSSRSWDGSICPQLCLYDEGDNMFPRVTQCRDGSWCCHTVFNVNSTTCCDQGQGTFLDERGEVTDPPSSSSSSIPVSTVPAQTSTSSSTIPPSVSASAASEDRGNDDDEGDLSTGAKIGIGVGVGGGVLALAGLALAWFLMKRSRRAHHANTLDQTQGGGSAYHQNEVYAHYADKDAQYKPQMQQAPVEMGTEHARVEADAGQVVGELPGDSPGWREEEKRR